MTRYVQLATLLYVISIVSSVHSQFIEQGTTVTLNSENYVVFRDIGRRDTESSGVISGQAITLDFVQDGNPRECGPFDTGSGELRIGSLVVSITYVDKHHVWVISRLGHIADGAVLLRIDDCSILASYAGQGFELSPDNRHIAYTCPGSRVMDLKFIDDVMIYPKPASGFTKSGILGPERPDGTQLTRFLQDTTQTIALIDAESKWKEDGTYEFAVVEGEDQSSTSPVAIRVIGFSGETNTTPLDSITVEKNQPTVALGAQLMNRADARLDSELD